MKPADHILYDELKSISPLLAEMERINVFSVPDGYFEGLSFNIISQVANRKSAMEVPAGYFNTLSGHILSKIKQQESPTEELRKLSPMLYSIQGENVFTVPRGYFNDLADNIVKKTRPAKVKRISFTKNVRRYAMAAMVSGILATSGWWIAKSTTGNEASTMPSYFAEASKYKNVEQIEHDIEKIPDEAIIKYLETTGTDTDNALLANNIEASELPAESEYLLNEETLETYLKEIDIQTEN